MRSGCCSLQPRAPTRSADTANGTIAAELDKAIFQGTGTDGQPLGVIVGAGTYGISSEAGAADWASFRAEVVEFMLGNAANSPGAVRLMMRPETWSDLDDDLITGTAVSEWDRLTRQIPASNIVVAHNTLIAGQALLTTNAGGVAPFFVGLWGAVDLIRDPYSDAQSGGLRLTALTTADVTVARGVQSRILTGIGSGS